MLPIAAALLGSALLASLLYTALFGLLHGGVMLAAGPVCLGVVLLSFTVSCGLLFLIALPAIWLLHRLASLHPFGLGPVSAATLGAVFGMIWAVVQTPILSTAVPRAIYGLVADAPPGDLPPLLIVTALPFYLLAGAAAGLVFWHLGQNARALVGTDYPGQPDEAASLSWPPLAALGFPAVFVSIAWLGNMYAIATILLLVALLFLWVIGAGIAAYRAYDAACRHLWQRAVVCALLPLAVLLVINPVAPLRPLIRAADMLHFVASRAAYDRDVAALPHSAGAKFMFFPWRGDFAEYYGLVYDASDRAALPPEQRPLDWYPLHRYPNLRCNADTLIPLWDHYYLASFRWSGPPHG